MASKPTGRSTSPSRLTPSRRGRFLATSSFGTHDLRRAITEAERQRERQRRDQYEEETAVGRIKECYDDIAELKYGQWSRGYERCWQLFEKSDEKAFWQTILATVGNVRYKLREVCKNHKGSRPSSTPTASSRNWSKPFKTSSNNLEAKSKITRIKRISAKDFINLVQFLSSLRSGLHREVC